MRQLHRERRLRHLPQTPVRRDMRGDVSQGRRRHGEIALLPRRISRAARLYLAARRAGRRRYTGQGTAGAAGRSERGHTRNQSRRGGRSDRHVHCAPYQAAGHKSHEACAGYKHGQRYRIRRRGDAVPRARIARRTVND